MTVSCEDGYRLSGDSVITCVKDTEYDMRVAPSCTQSKYLQTSCYLLLVV